VRAWEDKFLQEQAAETTKQKEEKTKNTPSPRSMNACHSITTAHLQSVAEIKTQSTMKSSRKTLREFSPHTPLKNAEKEHK
jgi:hypothetical protein